MSVHSCVVRLSRVGPLSAGSRGSIQDPSLSCDAVLDLNAPLDKTYITCCNLLIELLLMSMVHQRVLVPRVTCRPARVHAQAAAQACGRWPFGLGPPPARLSLVRSSKYEKRTKLETCAVSLVRDHPRTKPGLYLGCISASPSSCACPCHSECVRAQLYAQSQKSVQLRPASGGHAQLHPWDAKSCPRTRSSRARLRCVAVSGVENGQGAPEAEARNETDEPAITNSISSVTTGRPSGPAANCAVTRRAPLAAEATRISVPPSDRSALWS